MTSGFAPGEMLRLVSEQNPWLRVPLADYEGHMRAPGVAQLDALGELFACALRTYVPRSVAVLGVAGGNGLDAVDLRTRRRKRCVENAVRLLRLDGHLSVVLQLPSAVSSDVSPSRFESFQHLRDDFSLVDRSVLTEILSAKDLQLVAESTRLTGGGKTLWLGVFQRRSA
jgi:hypothetical protein